MQWNLHLKLTIKCIKSKPSSYYEVQVTFLWKNVTIFFPVFLEKSKSGRALPLPENQGWWRLLDSVLIVTLPLRGRHVMRLSLSSAAARTPCSGGLRDFVCVLQVKDATPLAPRSSSPATTAAAWTQDWSATPPRSAATARTRRNARIVSASVANLA